MSIASLSRLARYVVVTRARRAKSRARVQRDRCREASLGYGPLAWAAAREAHWWAERC